MLNPHSKKRPIEIATEAHKIPDGFAVARPSMRLPLGLISEVDRRDSSENGMVYQAGLALEADNHMLLYDLLEHLGGRVISTIVGTEVTVVTRHKTYKGKGQAELLLQIIRDQLGAINAQHESCGILGDRQARLGGFDGPQT